jgi:hypothetical protein
MEGIEMKLPNLKNNLNLILGFIAAIMISLVLRDLISGSLQLRTAVFLVLAVAIGMYFLLNNLRLVFDILHRRWIRYALNFFLFTVIMLSIFVFVYLLALNNDAQIDVTANARYSLSAQTIKVLKNLKEDIEVYGFYGTYQKRYTMGRQQMDDLLEQFTLYGGKFSYKLYNINKEPEFAEKYKVTVPGTLIVTNGRKEEVVSDLSEEKVANAVIRVSRESGKKVYYLSGHGERSDTVTDGSGIYYLNQQLKNMNYKTETLKLSLTGGRVPDDCDLLIVAGLRADLFPLELKGIFDYIKRGGSLYVMLDPGMAPRTASDLDRLGVKIGRNIIVVNSVSELDFITGNIYTPITDNYGNSKITREFNLDTIYDKARSVETADKMPDGVKGNILVSTIENTHSEILSVDALSGMMKRSGKTEKNGPVSIGVTLEINTGKWTEPEIKLDDQEKSRLNTENISLEKKEKKISPEMDTTVSSKDARESTAKIVIMGDSDFAMDYIFGSRRGNYDFVLNTIAWLTEQEDLISIRPPHLEGTPIFLSDAEAKNILWVNVIIMPLAILIVGFLVLRSRKHRYFKSK